MQVFEKIKEKIGQSSIMMANSKKFYENPQNGRYVSEVVTIDTAMDIVDQVAEEYNNGWIPCSERLPEESLNSVIGWDEYRQRCCFVQYYNGIWKLGNYESVKITHWQPTPLDPVQQKGE